MVRRKTNVAESGYSGFSWLCSACSIDCMRRLLFTGSTIRMPLIVVAGNERLANAGSTPVGDGNVIVSAVWKVASVHELKNAVSKSGFRSDADGAPHVAPSETRLVVPLAVLGLTESVSLVITPPACPAPVLSKKTAITVCALASLYARKTNS